MKPLDLSKRPPRSPREKLDGLYMLPRTIDKLRAKLPGGNIGPYKIDGMSKRLLELLSIEEAQLQDVVEHASADDDVAAWLRQNADRSKDAEINERLSRRSYEDSADKAAFDEKYPVRARLGLSNVFDVLDADDREMFGG